MTRCFAIILGRVVMGALVWGLYEGACLAKDVETYLGVH